MKLLIVDDSQFMRTILKDIVTRTAWAGSEVLEASNGAEALALFESRKPDLVLLDIIMEPDISGMDVLKQIGGIAKAVVMVSSLGQDKNISDAKTLGAKEYIVKPFEEKQVVDTLNKLWPGENEVVGSPSSAPGV